MQESQFEEHRMRLGRSHIQLVLTDTHLQTEHKIQSSEVGNNLHLDLEKVRHAPDPVYEPAVLLFDVMKDLCHRCQRCWVR